jgi:hypothetical protein
MRDVCITIETITIVSGVHSISLLEGGGLIKI